MTKADIVNEISKQTGVEKAQVQQIVEAFMESVKNALIENKDKKGKDRGVFLRGFGRLHHQRPCSEGGEEYYRGYLHRYSRSLHSCIQAFQEFRGAD